MGFLLIVLINATFNCSSLTRISSVGLVDNITHSVNVSINGQENLHLTFTPPEVALNATYDCVSSVQLQFSAIPKRDNLFFEHMW